MLTAVSLKGDVLTEVCLWGDVLAHRRGQAAALTVDHVPMLASERARIEASGGMVTKHLP